jgi:oligopeptide transport system substrate-binding protein
VKIKPGLKWSDGQPILAKDFVAGIQRTCDPDNAGNYKDTISNIVGCDEFYAAATATDAEKTALRDKVGITATDDATVEIKLESAQPTFTLILSLWMTFPLPSHIVKTSSEPWPDVTKMVYSGPYKIQEYKAKDQAVLVRNDNFWGTPANIDKITMKYIDKLDVAENAYRADQIDITRVNLTNLQVVKADPTLGKEYFQVPGVTTRAVHNEPEQEAARQREGEARPFAGDRSGHSEQSRLPGRLYPQHDLDAPGSGGWRSDRKNLRQDGRLQR